MSVREERVQQVRALRKEGLNGPEIAKRLGVSTSYAYELIHDPAGETARARRQRYGAPCSVCGGPTDGSNGKKTQVKVCQKCRTWSREAILDAFARYVEKHGEAPCIADFTGGEYPAHRVVKRCFGSWNAGLLAAGLELNMDRRPETWEWVLDELRSGRPVREIAEELRCTPQNIYLRARYRGLSVRELRGGGPRASREETPRSVRLARLVRRGGHAKRCEEGWEVQMPDGKVVIV